MRAPSVSGTAAKLLACAGLVSGLAGTALAQSAPAADWTEIDSVVVREMRRQPVPGASMAVVVGDSVVLQRAYGIASIETGLPATPDMVFRVASVTKMFTGLQAAILARAGVVSLDAPIGQYSAGLHPALRALTLRQLLSHTAGLRDAAPALGSRDDSALGAAARRLGADAVFAAPGELYSYSNAGFMLAGAVLEDAAGVPFAELVARDILRPLGMERSSLRLVEAVTYPFALGHDRDPQTGAARVIRPAPDAAEMLPRAGVFSTAPDLARLAQAVMGGGDPGALAEGAAALATSPIASAPGGESAQRYGLGFRVVTTRGETEVGHYGGGLGYGAVVRMIPSTRVGVIILANRTGALLDAGATAVLARLVPDRSPPAEPSATPAEYPRATAENAGRYLNMPGEPLEFVADSGGLALVDDGERIPLYQVGPGVVAILDPSGRVAQPFIFARRAGGSPYVFLLGRAFLREEQDSPPRPR